MLAKIIYHISILLVIFENVTNDCFDLINNVAVYTGTTSITASGRVCQRWDSQDPHTHRYCCDKVTSADENYCRNPDDWPVPWCMTSDPAKQWENCGIPNCADTTTTSTTTTTTTARISTTPAEPTTTIEEHNSTISTIKPALSTTSNLCECPCSERNLFWKEFHYGNFTEERKLQILYQEMARLRKELIVDKQYLSAYRRRQISANDQRSSSVAIGRVAGGILVITFAFIVLNDLLSFFVHISNSCIKRKVCRLAP